MSLNCQNVIWLLVFYLFANSNIYSQTLQGRTLSSKGEELGSVIILVRNFDSKESVGFAISESGSYVLKIDSEYKRLQVEASTRGYFKSIQTLENLEKDKIYNLDFILESDSIHELEEVIIKAKKYPFQVNGDTTRFDVDSYKDGTERKVEDVLKKLPGIQVNEVSGEVKYKGKSIETVLLGGDNLFDYNYSLGTKNINVDIIDGVEAIENYSGNPLLNGLEGKDKVALNLKLKKGKTDLSGNVENGIGYSENPKLRVDFNANLLSTARNFKSFGVLSVNNIGENRTPYDYFDFSPSTEQIKSRETQIEKIIPEIRFANIINEKRINANTQSFANYNSVFNLNKNLSIKTNLYYITDIISNNQNYKSENIINQTPFTTVDQANLVRKPNLYRLDIETKYRISEKDLLEYRLKFYQEDIETKSDLVQNETKQISSALNSSNTFLSQSLLFTKRIDKKKAFQLLAQNYSNKIDQQYQLTPLLLNNSNESLQTTFLQKNATDAKSTIFGSNSWVKYHFSFGYKDEKIPLSSALSLLSSNLTKIDSSKNDLVFNKKIIYNYLHSELSFNKWSFLVSNRIDLITQKLNDAKTLIQMEGLGFDTNLLTKYKFANSYLSLGISYNQQPIADKHLFKQQIVTNNRTTVSNNPNLSFQRNSKYEVNYRKDDLYNQFHLDFNLTYHIIDGNFFSRYNVEQNQTNINYIFLSDKNKITSAHVEISKYVTQIESNLKLTFNFTDADYINFLNNSDQRQNNSKIFEITLFNKSAYDGLFNYENSFQLSSSVSKNQSEAPFENNLIDNTFKFIFKPSKNWFALLSYNCFIPKVGNGELAYNFIDTIIRYRPNRNKYEFSFTAKNLANENSLIQIQTSDYSTNVYQTNLIPRYFMFSFMVTL